MKITHLEKCSDKQNWKGFDMLIKLKCWIIDNKCDTCNYTENIIT